MKSATSTAAFALFLVVFALYIIILDKLVYMLSVMLLLIALALFCEVIWQNENKKFIRRIVQTGFVGLLIGIIITANTYGINNYGSMELVSSVIGKLRVLNGNSDIALISDGKYVTMNNTNTDSDIYITAPGNGESATIALLQQNYAETVMIDESGEVTSGGERITTVKIMQYTDYDLVFIKH